MGDNKYSESTLMLSGERLILLLLCSVSFQQLTGQTITSWVPSSAGHYFESTAHLPRGADMQRLRRAKNKELNKLIETDIYERNNISDGTRSTSNL
jgi:hypothetical protein